ncbi:MAG: 2-oxoacid:acceptor oxidoreductase family protein [Leptospiraceae bacterium]|nr:2-oxoacid:acceptor oxidoreductase family protein [Leptospiraceae bacterium]
MWSGLFFGLGSDGTISANKMSLKIIGERTSLYTQGYFEYDSKKSGSMTVSHLRICDKPIRSTYRIVEADFIAVHDEKFFHTRDVLSAAKEGAILLVNTVREKEKFFSALPPSVQDTIFKIKLKVFLINAYAVAASMGLGRRINTIMQVCFFKLTPFLTIDEALEALKSHIEQTWGRRGREIVMRNVAGLELALAALEQLDYSQISREQTSGKLATTGENDFVSKVTIPLLRGMGDSLPVSTFPPDGSWPTGTAKLEKRQLATQIPVWQSELCVQCNFCVMICPHAAIRSKIVAPSEIKDPPENFSSLPVQFSEELASYHFVLAVAPEDCTGCGLCIEVCPARDRKMPKRKALVPQDFHTTLGPAKAEWEYFLSLPSVPVREIPPDRRTLVLREPLFEFPGACAGCGETPYIRLLTQLFGDHLVIANATGCSSIYGANLPTTPYTKNNEGQGPAWANSLFEDNAEFGFGISLALAQKEREAFEKLRLLKDKIPPSLWHKVHEKGVGDLWAWQRRKAIQELALYLRDIGEESDFLNSLLPKSVWIIGGDGWAYDIGYGGLDHVLASRQKINILVLDTEVYSNTGGQASKATPLGAAAKFAISGKRTRKKDLGLLAMSYGHVYVAQIALQANSKHAVECFLEAASYPGPSLLLAHCPCIAHGYDLRLSPQQQKRAIASGMWPLYRYNPLLVEKGETPLILDSGKPTLDVAQYMENESRFTMVQLRDPEEYEKLIEMARLAVKQRYAYYEQLSHIHLPKES